MHFAPLNAPEGACDWPLHAVVAHAGTFGVVISKSDGRTSIALIQRQYEPRHRSDVCVDEIVDLAAMALPGGRYLIRTAKTQAWKSGVAVGQCTPAIARAIVQALRREAEASAHEYKYRRLADMPDAVVLPKRSHGTRQAGAHLS